ncbi:MAG: hypothetical protein R3C20_05935 [Planctomycetaceae bacterium]
MRNNAKARVVDLTQPLPAATGGSLVQLARSGCVTQSTPAVTRPAKPKLPGAEATKPNLVPVTESDWNDLASDAQDAPNEPMTYPISSPSPSSPPPIEGLRERRNAEQRIDDLMQPRRAVHGQLAGALLAVTLVVFILCGIAGAVWLVKKNPQWLQRKETSGGNDADSFKE